MIHQVINAYRTQSSGSVNKFNYAGLTGGTSAVTETHVANTLNLQSVAMPSGGSQQVVRMFLRQASATAAGIKVRPVIYSNNAGSPGTLLYSGDEYTTASETQNRDIPLTFSSTPTLSGGTTYWFGFITDGAFRSINAGASVGYSTVSATYASGAPSSPTGFSTDVNDFILYVSYGESATLSGTGYLSNVTTSIVSTFDRLAMVDRGLNDIALLHITFINSASAPTFVTPSGWTKIDEQNIGGAANYRELLYVKRIDGTEPVTQILETGATVGVLQSTISLWRGYQLTDPVYEAEATAGGVSSTAPAGSTISTLGANRTVVNFYSNESAKALNGGNLNGWADVYNLQTTTGSDCTSNCSYKDVASASSVTAESRSFATASRWRSMTLALIKA